LLNEFAGWEFLLYQYLWEDIVVILDFNLNKARRRANMEKLKMPHPKHDTHLCYLVNMGHIKSNLEEYKKLVKDPKFVCKTCGRSGNSKELLCWPVKI
jgi:hypothetical protein